MLEHDALLDTLKAHPRGDYAPPFMRAIAAAIDLGILTAACFTSAAMLASVAGYHTTYDASTGTQTTYFLFSPALVIALVLAYFPASWATWGRTLGMRLVGLRIVHEDTRERIDRGTAFVRFGALLLATVPALAGLVVAFVDERRQAWHDRLCHTVVVAE